jgi:hypothetical protein
MRRERQLSTCGCNEMRERQRKDRGEILNEDGRELGWMKKIWERRDRMEKETGGDRKKNVIFFGFVIFIFRYNCKQESESPESK